MTPRKQWPSGMDKLGVKLSGRIGDGPAAGRVIGRLTDLGWGARLRRLLDEPDGAVPPTRCCAPPSRAGRRGHGQTRPTAVMGLDSLTHPLLIGSLADAACRTRPAGQPRDTAVHPAASARDGGELRLPCCRAARFVVGARPVGDAGWMARCCLVDDVTDYRLDD